MIILAIFFIVIALAVTVAGAKIIAYGMSDADNYSRRNMPNTPSSTGPSKTPPPPKTSPSSTPVPKR